MDSDGSGLTVAGSVVGLVLVGWGIAGASWAVALIGLAAIVIAAVLESTFDG